MAAAGGRIGHQLVVYRYGLHLLYDREIKNPGKTMPRALIGSCLLVLVLYSLLALVFPV